MKHGNISVFVPHNGCPHQCSFCNQKSITGVQYQPTPEDVDNAVYTALAFQKKYDYEIAFFGGSFTAINREYMLSLLNAAYKYVKSGDVRGIRLSTRPDAIDREVLDILKSYGVTSIELGAQSMCDEVLSANLRGHTSDDVANSSRLIKEYGFSLGLQMMTGLYKSSYDRDVYTAKRIIELAPETVRVYPTITLGGTMLGDLYLKGEYIPQTLDESVDLCALLLKMFWKNNIEVIRLGLHYSEDLKKGMLFNNYHPAFKELCESKIFIDEFRKQFGIDENACFNESVNVTVSINPKSVSKFVGQGRENIKRLALQGINVNIVQDNDIALYGLKIVG
ncbi:MAG: radical SAM protein [Acutalibacteraceae bacterium]|nr:radical SAM protein [Acutalibacteraceae bacterium]